ncbi:hypothetical protein WR25_26491 [Diploscapter pachys]|uniref:Snurportin-1 n=1 Tax=Diploscapter pachys TaxID=2018661 RepID=A0A2A2KRN7_9BILA|nr:hypothetical protein WR25_26491 [Diploscapter pachys]
MASIDDLIGKLDDAKVDSTNMGEHPHFSKFKNASQAAERQAQRRREFMDRQREARQDQFMRYRRLIEAKDDEVDDDAEMASEGSNAIEQPLDLTTTSARTRDIGKKNLKYADQLMLSEWLIDIPDYEQLSADWYMLPTPKGKHVLVVASRGITSTYDKRGKMMNQFESELPGGCRKNKGKRGNFTILDCILVQGHKYYCLDIISWGGNMMTDNPFDFRRFMLNSKLEDTPELQTPNRHMRKQFIPLPMCKCEKKQMEEMMKTDFLFELDGLLFYHQSVFYESGQNPLVGWLKPWMMPELLDIQVPQRYNKDNPANQTSREFINAFNLAHNHRSLSQKKQYEENESIVDMVEVQKEDNEE